MGIISIAATGLAGLLAPLIGTNPEPVKVPEQALVASPASTTRGTMIMVHGGGWAGPAPITQKSLMSIPGETFSGRGWKIVSLDYHAGSASLQDVLDAAGQEVAQSTGGPVCLYGESAGGQLSLVTAARLSGISCVAVLGPPADFETYQAEVRASNDGGRSIIAAQMASVWGQTPDERAPNDPVKLAPSIRADVLIMREADDPLIPIEQIDNFVAARPTTEHVELQSAPGSDPAQHYLHGTLSDTGRSEFRAALGSFIDRAAAAYDAERAASRMGCPGVRKSVTQAGVARVQAALRCLARRDKLVRKAGAARAKTTSRKARGELNAARAWNLLRASAGGRRALAALVAKRATTTIRTGNPSRVILRVRR